MFISTFICIPSNILPFFITFFYFSWNNSR
nr:MAG TPA: hypothetical protein [Caudoviricetes sp.]